MVQLVFSDDVMKIELMISSWYAKEMFGLACMYIIASCLIWSGRMSQTMVFCILCLKKVLLKHYDFF